VASVRGRRANLNAQKVQRKNLDLPASYLRKSVDIVNKSKNRYLDLAVCLRRRSRWHSVALIERCGAVDSRKSVRNLPPVRKFAPRIQAAIHAFAISLVNGLQN
jgi:hypothetical protein